MNILKTFVRNFSANRQTCIINMLSLIPGLACCLLILLWVVFEVQTDRNFPKIDRIVTVNGYHEGLVPFAGAPPAVGPTLKQELPEVEAAARMAYAYDKIQYNTDKYNFISYNVDADIFGIFDFTFQEGIPFTDEEYDKCVISEKIAKAIFGKESALGKFLQFEDEKFVVCGVTRDLPKNTTVSVHVFLPIRRQGESLNFWYNNSFYTYVLLKDASQITGFPDKIKDRAMKAAPGNKLYLTSFPLKDRYLIQYGNLKNVRLMGMIALFVLVIACINFVNLATAGFTRTSFQTGIRKVIGATRRSLLLTNFANTFLLVGLSFFIAVLLALALLPAFNLMIGRHFVSSDFLSPAIVWISVAIIGITTLLAGLYPSVYVSSFNPVKVLKGPHAVGGKGTWFRNFLVIAQFTIAITLIICTVVISKQIRMFQQMDLGYNHEEVVYVNLRNELVKKARVLKEELQEEPAVMAACIAQNVPAQINWNGTGWGWEGKDPAFVPLITFAFVDEDWAKVLGIRFKEGNFFTKDGEGVVINQKLAEMMGGTSWVDRYINRGENIKIVGVLDNFMYNNFKQESAPLVIFPLKDTDISRVGGCIMVRAKGENLTAIYDLVQKKARKLNGGEPAEVYFLDENVENMLYAEKQTTRMVSFFSVLAIVISCLGLFGLATFMMEQKRKEIGIRRVNGARIGEIVWLLNVNFLRPVVVSFLIACPLAYYLMSGWLESYLQRTELSWWIFVLAGCLTAMIAVVTLLWRSLRAATENPVNSLKSE